MLLVLKKQQLDQTMHNTQPIATPNWPQLNQPPPISIETCNTQVAFLQKQISMLQDQLQQSEKNLNAQREVMKINRKVNQA